MLSQRQARNCQPFFLRRRSEAECLLCRNYSQNLQPLVVRSFRPDGGQVLVVLHLAPAAARTVYV